MRLGWGVAAVGALGLAVAACNSSSPTPSPTPTPTPTGTPTPTPTPTDVTFTTSEAALQYDLVGGVQTVANLTSVAPAMGTVFSYTPSDGGYTYTLLNGTVTPTASEEALFPVASIATCDRDPLCFGDGFVHQLVANGTSNYYLTRLVSGTNPVISLAFVSFGAFEESLVDGSDVDLRPFAYGVATVAAQLPTTGTQTFNGVITGQATGNKPGGTGLSNIYRIGGTLQLVPNYAAGTATLKLTIEGTAVGCTTCSPDIDLTYDVTGTYAAGIATFTLPGGSAVFFLAGTNAVEIGGTFLLTVADPNEAAVTMTLAGSGGGRR